MTQDVQQDANQQPALNVPVNVDAVRDAARAANEAAQSRVLGFQRMRDPDVSVNDGDNVLMVKGDEGKILYSIRRDGTIFCNADIPNADQEAAERFLHTVALGMGKLLKEREIEAQTPFVLLLRSIKKAGWVKDRALRDLLNSFAQFAVTTGEESALPARLPLQTDIQAYMELHDLTDLSHLLDEGDRVAAGLREGYIRVLVHMMTVALKALIATSDADAQETVKSALCDEVNQDR